jgi:hypothetical protein
MNTPHKRCIVVPDDQLDKLYYDYLNTRKTLRHLAKEAQIDIRVLRRNLLRRFPNMSYIKKYRIRVNESYFDNIGPEQAYVMGLIASDGYVIDHKKSGGKSRGQQYWGIQLQEGDRDILEKVRTAIELETELAYRPKRQKTWQGSYTLKARSDKMVNRLIELGIRPRKSLTFGMPDVIRQNECLFMPFLRGYFDGDGCITSSWVKTNNDRSGYEVFRWMIIGTEETCRYISETLHNRHGLGSGDYQERIHTDHRVPTYSMCVSGNHQILKLYELLYKDATIWMNRKREKMQQIIEVCRRPNKKPPKKPVVREDDKIYVSMTDAAKDIGVSQDRIRIAIKLNRCVKGYRFRFTNTIAIN